MFIHTVFTGILFSRSGKYVGHENSNNTINDKQSHGNCKVTKLFIGIYL